MGKKNKDSLGRALIKDRFSKNKHRKHVENNTMLHTTEVNDGYDWGRLNLQSVTAESSLQEFLSTAELAQREFAAEKLNIKYIKSVPSEVSVITTQPNFNEPLTVPRRPQWRPGVTAEEQLSKERESFLEWRRNLNELQAKLGAALTPYERNLELWRQLWRTLEKSDIVLILLDARNPLLFRCVDLEHYAAQQNCKCILLLNKADLITEYERKCWTEFFNSQTVNRTRLALALAVAEWRRLERAHSVTNHRARNTPIIFFSAAKVNKEKNVHEEDEKFLNKLMSTESSDNESEQEIKLNENFVEENDLIDTENDIERFKKQIHCLANAVSNTESKIDKIQAALDKIVENLKLGISISPLELEKTHNNCEENSEVLQNSKELCETIGLSQPLSTSESLSINSHEILDRSKLLEILKKYLVVEKLKNPPRLTVGMIGYPNVGKSSTVNILMQTKKVSVSTMPGHTRHVQSLLLDEELEILDCPGLVLPAYAVAPDLLLTAVLPIDQMRSHDAAMARLCQLVPKKTFEEKYGLLLPQDDNESALSYKQILTAHAFNRGFMTAAGQPDVSRSARLLLKDAATGRLQWAVLPHGVTLKSESVNETPKVGERRKPTPREARMVEGWLNKSSEIDKAFFAMSKSSAHTKGKPIMGITGTATPQDASAKPWKLEKRHANKNKREKLRRVYAHLDEH
ncbi:Large subunit GTPase 1 homolog [Eumeta japonica]|uniref:Large subunit GTPase 1 homolog n=1 Tax=Eumeta variegata TaxID=151549 RepID=A0A4C1VJF2_EUMVA|nr:Large subunit GTPase 1 homolog [Eumeta japonica]